VFGDTDSVITCFKLDKRHRKCYVTSNKGIGKVLNIQNGVCLKTFINKKGDKEALESPEESGESDHNSDCDSNQDSPSG
jgi:hypothetical protein